MGIAKKLVLGVLAVATVFVAAGIVINSTPEGKARMQDRAAIDYCWGEYNGKKSLDPATLRFIAGTCERMETEFRDRWGRAP